MNKIYTSFLFILLFLQYNGCTIFSNKVTDTNIKGIVKTNRNVERISYTHKYQKNTIKALPIIFSTGYIKKNNTKFVEIEFRSYNKKAPLDFQMIEMYNSKGDKWQWNVNKINKIYEKKRIFNIESYHARVDSKVNDLIRFFNQSPIYLKYIGSMNNFRTLDNMHVESILMVLQYAKSLE